MINAVFLDRDGIINEVVERDGVIASPRNVSEFKIRADFLAFWEVMKDLPLHFFVVSNQPDIRRELMTSAALNKIDELMMKQFRFREIVYCTHDDRDDCDCRKPRPGMILKLLSKYGLRTDEAILIGDRYKDILAGSAAGIRTILCCQSYNAHDSCQPDYKVDRLTEIAPLGLFQTLGKSE